MIPTFLGITFLCFAIIQFIPGGPVEQAIMKMRGDGSGGEVTASVNTKNGGISEEQREAIRKYYGFDKPFLKRYAEWLWTNRIGLKMESYRFPNRTAWQLIKARFPVSIIFGITGFLLTYLVCIPLGMAKALKNGTPFDFITSIAVFSGYAIPVFALGMLMKMLFCGTVENLWDIFPATGFHTQNFADLTFLEKAKDVTMHMILPIICYMSGSFAVLTMLMKNSLLEQIGSDYVRTVAAKGAGTLRILCVHMLRNALIPIATGFGSVLTLIFSGSVIIEQVFEIPGMGMLSLESIVGRDYPVFMGILALTSLLSLAGNILSDFAYMIIDPRISFSRS